MNWKIANLIVLSLLILISGLGTFYKHISFGAGLGDMIGYFFLYVSTFIHFILTITSKSENRTKKLTIIFGIILVFGSLQATLWRGSEYEWNGSIFYLPCPTEILLIKDRSKTNTLISMCTMNYYSEFTGDWDGEYLIITGGKLKIPDELKKYILLPIDKVRIDPSYASIYNNGTYKKYYYFATDNLHKNQTYKMAGEIRGVIDRVPIFEVRILK